MSPVFDPLPLASSTILAAAVLLPRPLPRRSKPSRRSRTCSSDIEDQEQKILVLERKLEDPGRHGQDGHKPQTTPVVKASPKGFSFQVAGRPRTSSSCAARFTSTAAFSESDDPARRRSRIPGRSLACVRSSKAQSAAFTTSSSCRISARARRSSRTRTSPRASCREFRSRPASSSCAVGLERLQSANDIRFVARAFPTQHRPEPGPRIAGRRQPAERPVELRGVVDPQRRQRRQQHRCVCRRGH